MDRGRGHETGRVLISGTVPDLRASTRGACKRQLAATRSDRPSSSHCLLSNSDSHVPLCPPLRAASLPFSFCLRLQPRLPTRTPGDINHGDESLTHRNMRRVLSLANIPILTFPDSDMLCSFLRPSTVAQRLLLASVTIVYSVKGLPFVFIIIYFSDCSDELRAEFHALHKLYTLCNDEPLFAIPRTQVAYYNSRTNESL